MGIAMPKIPRRQYVRSSFLFVSLFAAHDIRWATLASGSFVTPTKNWRGILATFSTIAAS
jgi:hypothetical protein